MMNSYYGHQVNEVREQAAQAGLSGSAIIDVRPQAGFVRVKVKMNSPEMLPEFMRNYANVLATTLGMMNFEAKIHVSEE